MTHTVNELGRHDCTVVARKCQLSQKLRALGTTRVAPSPSIDLAVLLWPWGLSVSGYTVTEPKAAPSFQSLCFFYFKKSCLMFSWIVSCLILGVGFYNIYLVFLYIKNLKSSSRWAFNPFLQKLAFQCFKSQLKNLLFVTAFGFSTFRLEMSVEKQEQTGLQKSLSTQTEESDTTYPIKSVIFYHLFY
jgi:hypothetical protein